MKTLLPHLTAGDLPKPFGAGAEGRFGLTPRLLIEENKTHLAYPLKIN